MSVLINNSDKKDIRKKLRNNMTEPERKLWYYLRKKQLNGVKFRRQCSIGKYIVDFYSFEKKLVIEIDGDSHFETPEAIKYNKKRTDFLKEQEMKIVRFTNQEIMTNVQGCLEVILKFIE